MIVWTSLNATLSGEAKQDLLEKRINLLNCQHCSAETQIQLKMLYHDMKIGFCAMYVPFSTIIDESLVFDFNRHGELDSGEDSENETDKEKPYDYMEHIHLVFDMDELVRYVLFRDKLFEDYGATDQISERLLAVQEKARSGEPRFF